ncbi:MAG: arsenate reductase/protein-tyrosine-phosphatase family protein [Sporichthyaceae bacterium]
MSGSRFSVLFVSTGNVCRSPLAERLLRHELTQVGGSPLEWLRCESAGIWGHEGAPMEANSARVLIELGADPEGFVARELSALQVRLADLIIVAGREHREQVRLLDPGAAGRTFALKEFVRLAQPGAGGAPVVPQAGPVADPGARARALVAAASIARAPAAGLDPAQHSAHHSADHIADPYGAPLHVFRLCARTIACSVGELVAALTGVRPRESGRAHQAVG